MQEIGLGIKKIEVDLKKNKMNFRMFGKNGQESWEVFPKKKSKKNKCISA